VFSRVVWVDLSFYLTLVLPLPLLLSSCVYVFFAVHGAVTFVCDYTCIFLLQDFGIPYLCVIVLILSILYVCYRNVPCFLGLACVNLRHTLPIVVLLSFCCLTSSVCVFLEFSLTFCMVPSLVFLFLYLCSVSLCCTSSCSVLSYGLCSLSLCSCDHVLL